MPNEVQIKGSLVQDLLNTVQEFESQVQIELSLVQDLLNRDHFEIKVQIEVVQDLPNRDQVQEFEIKVQKSMNLNGAQNLVKIEVQIKF